MSDVGELLADRYRLERQLGSGAMGVVWLATDERLRRPVAVKQLINQHGLDEARAEQARQRAMREGRIAGRLHHPNVVAVHDVTEHGGLPVLVMEYLPSRSLAGLLAERGSLAPESAADIGVQAAAALDAAHEAGIVHRDIKPGNVLLGDDGTVKITDFGISHAAGDVALTQTGLLAGTPAFLAPEIARGHPPTPAADVYSLGATLYAAVEGHPPFGLRGENSLALLHEVAAGDVPPPQRAGPLTPVLANMMHTDPAARWGPRDARDAMRAVASGESVLPTVVLEDRTEPMASVPTTAVHTGGGSGTRLDAGPVESSPHGTSVGVPGTPGDRPVRNRKPGYIAAAVAAALLAGIVLVTQLDFGSAPPARPPAQAIAPADLERVVSDYYALLPEHPANAWTRLGPGLRAQGQQRYQNYWDSVTGVTVISPPRTIGDKTVHAGVELALPDGTKIREFHQLGMAGGARAPVIDSDTVLHAETLAPPPPPPAEPPERNEHGNGKGDKKDQRGKKDDD